MLNTYTVLWLDRKMQGTPGQTVFHYAMMDFEKMRQCREGKYYDHLWSRQTELYLK